MMVEQNYGSKILEQIREDMEVIDSRGEAVGTVERIQLGIDNLTGKGPATPASGIGERNPSWMESLARSFVPDDRIPEEVQERLRQSGFIRVNSKRLFAKDRYIIPEQIDRVGEGKVILRVDYESLFHPTEE